MGADSPDDSLLFAGGLPGACAGAAVGRRPTPFRCSCSTSRKRSRPSSCAATRACCSWTGTAAHARASGWSGGSSCDAFTAIVPVTVARGRPPPGAGAGLVRSRGGRGHHRHLLAGRAAGAARCDARADRAGRVGASVHPAARHHRDRAGDPPPARVGSGVRGLLRRSRPLQGVQRPLQLLRRRSGHLPAVAHPARRRQGPAGAARLRGAHRRRRFHLRGPDGGDQPGLQRDPRRVRHPDSAAVQRAGSAGGIFLREGPARPAPPRAR